MSPAAHAHIQLGYAASGGRRMRESRGVRNAEWNLIRSDLKICMLMVPLQELGRLLGTTKVISLCSKVLMQIQAETKQIEVQKCTYIKVCVRRGKNPMCCCEF